MVEIIITIVICGFAGYVIIKSLKNASKGKCNSGCSGCAAKKNCTSKDNITIKKE